MTATIQRYTLALRLVLLLALPAALAAAQDAALPTVTIKEHALVSGDVVRLCDVADVQGEAPAGLEQLVLGNAPWPGNGRAISRMLVKARMLSAGLELQGVQFAGADLCTVEAASMRIEPARLADEAEAYVRSFFAGSGTEVSVTLERDVMPVLVAVGQEEPALRAVVSGPGLPVGAVRVDVEITRGNVLLKRVPVTLSVRTYRTVGVALKPIVPGEALTAGNVTFARRDVTDVSGASLDKAQDMVGRVADHAMAPGQVVTSRPAAQAESQMVIKANQNVFLVVQTPTLKVVTLGKALGNARKGEIAHARNLSTGREVVGVAADAGVIQVGIGGPNDGS